MKWRAVWLLLVLPLVSGCAIWFGPPLPVAVVTADPRTGTAPLTVTFDGGESYDRMSVAIEEYKWDFGDGTEAEGVTVTHTYENPGDYTATLRVFNRLGLKGEATLSVCATGSGGDPGGLGPLTGRWEGTMTFTAGDIAGREYALVLVLVQVDSDEISGALAIAIEDPVYGLEYDAAVIQGECHGSALELLSGWILGSATYRLTGSVSGNKIAGLFSRAQEFDPYTGRAGTWEVTRVE